MDSIAPARGRGMQVLGFVPRQGFLPTTPLRREQPEPPAAVAAKSPEATDEAVPGVVNGPARWKRGRPVYERGNYGAYYGYRYGQGDKAGDPRLAAVVARLGADAFVGKDVLDVGCNAGLVSLSAAQHFGAASVVGVDVDRALVEGARGNRRSLRQGGAAGAEVAGRVKFRTEDILCSPLRRPPAMEPERFDVILCLSVTKWVHFAAGDAGLLRLFRRLQRRLRPGGLLVLEPQEWSSYRKKRHITPEIRQTVAGIRLRPELFDAELEALGLQSAGVLAPPADAPPNFRRSVRLFRKPSEPPKAEGAPAGSVGDKRRRDVEDACETRKRRRGGS